MKFRYGLRTGSVYSQDESGRGSGAGNVLTARNHHTFSYMHEPTNISFS